MRTKYRQDFLKNRQLFDLVDSIGPLLDGDLHILDVSGQSAVWTEKTYHVYNSDGYCFCISKDIERMDEKEEKVLEYTYQFFAIWDGFEHDLSIHSALRAVEYSILSGETDTDKSRVQVILYHKEIGLAISEEDKETIVEFIKSHLVMVGDQEIISAMQNLFPEEYGKGIDLQDNE